MLYVTNRLLLICYVYLTQYESVIMSYRLNVLVSQNPWWKEPTFIDYKVRDEYLRILQYLNEPQIIAITGIRRVGKTTTLYKLIEKYISEGFNKDNILFVSFDEFKKEKIRDIIDEYCLFKKKNLLTDKFVFVFDEIQKVDDWENQLKSIYDVYKLKGNIKIFISGSESLFIRKRSKESLAGRIYEFKLNPLSFKEYLSFINYHYDDIDLYNNELLLKFNEYIISQGFPELVNQTSKEIIKNYISGIIEKVIYTDIAIQFKVKDPSALESVIRIISNEPGQIIDNNRLAKELELSRQLISNYLRYLCDSFLVLKLYNFSKNQRKSEIKQKKYYPVVLPSQLIFSDDNLIKSKIFESIIVNQLQSSFFWRTSQQDEVDIIIVNNKIIPIEVKYGKIETNGILKFLTKFNLDKGYIISYKEEKIITQIVNVREGTGVVKKVEKTIYVIPAYKFLLLKDKYLDI